MNKRFRLMKSAAMLAVFLAPCAFLSLGLDAKDKEPVRHWDFQSSKLDSDKIPEGWSYRGKPGTPDVKYEIVEDKELKHKVLHITSDKASGVIMVDCSDVDLKKYPIMRWRWKAVTLPTGADATVKSKDDQGIAVYVGYGKLTQSSISYNWQTETPKGKTGSSTYNYGGSNYRYGGYRYGGGYSGYRGGSYGGGGGGSSYNPKIYSTSRNVSARSASGLSTRSPYKATGTYLRPAFYTSGSRSSYLRMG